MTGPTWTQERTDGYHRARALGVLILYVLAVTLVIVMAVAGLLLEAGMAAVALIVVWSAYASGELDDAERRRDDR